MFFIVSALINAITSTVLGLFIILKQRTKLNNSFAMFCFCVAFWSYAYFIWLLSVKENNAIFWVKILTVGSILIPLAYFRFSIIFLNIYNLKFNKFLLYLSYVLVAFLLIITPTDLLVSGVEQKLSFKFWPIPGELYVLFLMIFFALILYSMFLYFKFFKKAKTKKQIKFLLIGIWFAFLGGSTNYFLWYNIPIPPVGNVLVSFYVLFTAYAIVIHDFMNIKIVLRRYSVYVISVILVSLIALIVKFIATLYFVKYSILIDFVILIASVSMFNQVKVYFYSLANKYFFSSLYDSKIVIIEINNKLNSALEIKEIFKHIYNVLNKSFHVGSFSAVFYNNEKKGYIFQYNIGFNVDMRRIFLGNMYFNNIFFSKNKSIIVDEVKSMHYNIKTKKFIDLLLKLKVALVAPLNIKNETIGLLFLGKKDSRDKYSIEDLLVLEAIGTQIAFAVKKAMPYEEAKDYNIKLLKKVKNTNIDMDNASKKFKILDQAKSDFISITSHQLRTPLTAMKGYLSMMLDGDFGKLKQTQKDSLQKVFDSGERLLNLVENLLNISRIESGRIIFQYKIMQLENIVSSVVEELSLSVKKKGLDLVYKKKLKKLPKVKIDEEKIRQVIINLIDNATKYTRKGKIKINLKQRKNKIQFCISDKGIGIKKEYLSNLFKKFSRVEGVSLVHTEGTGLGLYVAKQMIKAHKGKIWAESNGDGAGSRFYFELPI